MVPAHICVEGVRIGGDSMLCCSHSYLCLYRIKASFSRDISLQAVEVQRSTTCMGVGEELKVKGQPPAWGWERS